MKGSTLLLCLFSLSVLLIGCGQEEISKQDATQSNSIANPLNGTTKFGLSEDQRQEVFGAIGEAELRASNEAETKYPNDLTKYAELQRELVTKYYQECKKKYSITTGQILEIVQEGMQKGWQ